LEYKNIELAIFAVSLPGKVKDKFKNAKFSHIQMKLGNNPARTSQLLDNVPPILTEPVTLHFRGAFPKYFATLYKIV
jgi:hypothetical protein